MLAHASTQWPLEGLGRIALPLEICPLTSTAVLANKVNSFVKSILTRWERRYPEILAPWLRRYVLYQVQGKLRRNGELTLRLHLQFARSQDSG